MRNAKISCLLASLVLISSMVTGESFFNVTSPVPATVYVNNTLKGPVNASTPVEFKISDPGTYVIEVRQNDAKLIHREEFEVRQNVSERRDIRAFADIQTTPPVTTSPVPTPPPSKDYVSREEMMAAIQEATKKARAETLAEEDARRKRAAKRALTNKGIGHVVGVEANRGLPSSVKNMERIKLLLEALPSFKK